MDTEIFLKAGVDLPEGGECLPPFIIHFHIDTANIRFAHDKALILLKAVDRNAGRTFDSDTARAEYLIADAIAANAHTVHEVMQALAFILVFLCTDTPEKMEALVGGEIAKAGTLILPLDDPAANDDDRIFQFRHVTQPV